MGNITKDLAWKDEIPQKFTSAEMTEIKNAISQETVNVKIAPYHVYSPNEQVVGEWQQMVDGVLKKKLVYEKRYSYSNVRCTSAIQNLGSIDNSFIPISMTGYVKYNDSSVWMINYKQDDTYTVWADISSGTLRFYAKWDNITLDSVYFIVQYTKTTDEWEVVE